MAERKNGPVNIREMVEVINRVDSRTCLLTVLDQGDIKVRLDELLPEIFGVRTEELDITRTAMFGNDRGWVEPMEGEKIWAATS